MAPQFEVSRDPGQARPFGVLLRNSEGGILADLGRFADLERVRQAIHLVRETAAQGHVVDLTGRAAPQP